MKNHLYQQLLLPPIIIDNEEEYEVEEILDRKEV